PPGPWASGSAGVTIRDRVILVVLCVVVVIAAAAVIVTTVQADTGEQTATGGDDPLTSDHPTETPTPQAPDGDDAAWPAARHTTARAVAGARSALDRARPVVARAAREAAAAIRRAALAVARPARGGRRPAGGRGATSVA